MTIVLSKKSARFFIGIAFYLLYIYYIYFYVIYMTKMTNIYKV